MGARITGFSMPRMRSSGFYDLDKRRVLQYCLYVQKCPTTLQVRG